MDGRQRFCPVETTLSIVGGKWKIVILFHLRTETKRFSILKRSIPAISQKVLAQQLRELEADGVVYRRVYAQVPPKVEYSLTELGCSLEPVIAAMCDWGHHYAHQRGRKIVIED